MVFRILKLIEETLNFTHVVVASTNALDSVEHGVLKLNNVINYRFSCLIFAMV
jgi:hypothetical protein